MKRGNTSISFFLEGKMGKFKGRKELYLAVALTLLGATGLFSQERGSLDLSLQLGPPVTLPEKGEGPKGANTVAQQQPAQPSGPKKDAKEEPKVKPPVLPPPPSEEVVPYPYPPFSTYPAVRPVVQDPSTPSRVRDILGGSGKSIRPAMLGDLPPLPVLVPTPGGPVVLPSVRGFKIGDNESPRPLDRTYFNFNYYQDLYQSVNVRFGGDVTNINLHREILGYEKTFWCGQASIGFKMPIFTTTATSPIPELNGTHRTYGDLSIIFKGILSEKGMVDLITGGLAITPPTGSDTLFGSSAFGRVHSTTLQPFIGYIHSWGKVNVQGFSALDVPTANDVTLLYNDISLRYCLYRTETSNHFITAILPIAEFHLTTPLNHRGILDGTDPVGTPDILNVTGGVEVYFFDRASFVFAYVAPITGPRPFTMEIISQLKYAF
jgi:hypothetical protein